MVAIFTIFINLKQKRNVNILNSSKYLTEFITYIISGINTRPFVDNPANNFFLIKFISDNIR